MRRPFLLVLVVLTVLLLAVGLVLMLQDQPPEPPIAATTPLPAGEVQRISVNELSRQLSSENPPLIWEFVSAEQFERGHLPGAKLMTFGNLASAADGLNKEQAIVTLCT